MLGCQPSEPRLIVADPHEKECLWAPLTGLEMQSTRVEGSVLVIIVRVSVNMVSSTIEQAACKFSTSG